jgi:hypothetical protein
MKICECVVQLGAEGPISGINFSYDEKTQEKQTSKLLKLLIDSVFATTWHTCAIV